MNIGPVLEQFGVTEAEVAELANRLGPLEGIRPDAFVQAVALLKIQNLEKRIAEQPEYLTKDQAFKLMLDNTDISKPMERIKKAAESGMAFQRFTRDEISDEQLTKIKLLGYRITRYEPKRGNSLVAFVEWD